VGVPHVDGTGQSNAKNIAAAPVDQIQIEIILEIWGIQDLVGDLVHIPRLFAGCFQDTLAAISNRRKTVQLRAHVKIGAMQTPRCFGGGRVSRPRSGSTIIEDILVWGRGCNASGREIGGNKSRRSTRSSFVKDSVTEAEQWVGWHGVEVGLRDRVSKKLTAQDSGERAICFLACDEVSNYISLMVRSDSDILFWKCSSEWGGRFLVLEGVEGQPSSCRRL
jgi:hypothetical protein